MQRPVIHIIGAGLAGLPRRSRSGRAPCDIIVHEAARQAGGRCRSFFDESMGMTIDNGNHLLLSGNDSALAYLDAIGARQELRGPKRCEIAFADMASGERWTLRPNEGRLPWWLLVSGRRVPRTRPTDYLSVARLLARFAAGEGRRRHGMFGAALRALVGPYFLAALNTDPRGGVGRARWRRFCARPWRAAAAPAIRWSPPTACRAPSSIPR